MTGRYLTEMADVLRTAGLMVDEVEGWQTRARKSGGYQAGPHCVMWHHTASNTTPDNDIAYIVSGSDVAPVSNLYLARDGCVFVCAAGATNTNGSGGPVTTPSGVGIPADRMNEYAVSIEAANDGLGQVWPQPQIDAYFRTSLALTEWLGLRPDDVLTHAGWTSRKIDPATAAAVEGPWRPRAVNSSGTWNLDDIRGELWLRSEHLDPTEDHDVMYLATLNDGTVVIAGSAVRPVSGDEIGPGGPYAGLPRYVPDPQSYWHQWLRAAADEYSRRVMG